MLSSIAVADVVFLQVMVSAKEEPDSALPPAMDGLLRVHKRIVDGLDGDSSHVPSGTGTKVSTRLLVPASQAGSLIGKQGATVKSIQEASTCVVRVLGSGFLNKTLFVLFIHACFQLEFFLITFIVFLFVQLFVQVAS